MDAWPMIERCRRHQFPGPGSVEMYEPRDTVVNLIVDNGDRQQAVLKIKFVDAPRWKYLERLLECWDD